MRHRALAFGSAVLLGLAAAACATTPGSTAQADETLIQVENHNSLLVSVEAVVDGLDYNLGQVETGETRTFQLPEPVNEAFGLQLRVDPVGSTETYLSDDIAYVPGGMIFVEVESDLDLTTVATG